MSLAVDDIAIVAFLSSSQEEKSAFAAQPATSQPVGTRSDKQYLRQYDQTPDKTQQPITSGTVTLTWAPALPLDKQKQKEVCLINP